MSPRNAFDEDASFPIPATLIGQDIEILSIGTRNGRRELIATWAPGRGVEDHVASASIEARKP